jgi:hypothetical protein
LSKGGSAPLNSLSRIALGDNHRRTMSWSGTVAASLMLSLVVAPGAWAQERCGHVKYQLFTTMPPRGTLGEAQVSMRYRDISLHNLVCLATQLRTEHPEWRDVIVLIFDSLEAAYVYRGGLGKRRLAAACATVSSVRAADTGRTGHQP